MGYLEILEVKGISSSKSCSGSKQALEWGHSKYEHLNVKPLNLTFGIHKEKSTAEQKIGFCFFSFPIQYRAILLSSAFRLCTISTNHVTPSASLVRRKIILFQCSPGWHNRQGEHTKRSLAPQTMIAQNSGTTGLLPEATWANGSTQVKD